jgi:hypothetical protein
MANLMESSAMALKTCRVTILNTNGVQHTAQVIAETLYEAVARAISALKAHPWTDDLCEGIVRVTVQDTPVEHAVRLIEFKKWLAKNGGAPKNITRRQKVREILGKP